MENYQEETSGVGRLLLKAEMDDQISSRACVRVCVVGFFLNWLSRILVKTGLCKDRLRSRRSQPSKEEGSEEPD